MPQLSSLLAADTLAEGLARLADIEYAPLPDAVARLVLNGPRPLLTLDQDSPPEDLCWAMMDAMRALAFGLHATESARSTCRLRSVS